MNMKKINISILALGIIPIITSCDSYLDTLPDDRAEVNSVEKVQSLLTTAYPSNTSAMVLEISSDNVMDNGTLYKTQPNIDKAYRWEEIETTGNDDPKSLWQSTYTAVATANEALNGLATLAESSKTKGIKAEALLCRAYSMFSLANTFCMAYDPTKAQSTYLGLPYPKVSGVSVNERGTLEELYANINEDIEEALPLLDDSYLTVPKYHFNAKAAYAFAARFNLFYLKYDKAIEYATKALGNVPQSLLRQTSSYIGLAGVDDISNAYIRSGQNCNFMMQTAYSLVGRIFTSSSYRRYCSARPIVANELFWAKMPWAPAGGSTNNSLCESHLLFGSNQSVYYPKMMEIFEVTDKINQTGFAHIVNVPFTADETLLVRAEAKAMLKKYNEAVEDINLWISVRCSKKKSGTAPVPVMTAESIKTFMEGLREVPSVIVDDTQRGVRKPLHPQGYTVEAGEQTAIIQFILQMRRIETWQQGMRMQDIKRWGIEFSHNLEGEKTLEFKAGDYRGAIQIPQDVLAAGIEPNPRD